MEALEIDPIRFNNPYFFGDELTNLQDAINLGRLSGNGKYTKKCHEFFQSKYGFGKCLLTTSCTDALEMIALLLRIEVGDEVIMPSYTFVSTANAFVLRGAKIKFVDSRPDHPNMNESDIRGLISNRTKAIVVVHYGGVACEMDSIMSISAEFGIPVVEDAAQAIDSYYQGKPLGSIGHLSAFSFHETKNVVSGEGGMLVINDDQYSERAEILWEKGTDRSAFFRGEIDKYGWVDIGSSFLPSDLIAAFLWGQLQNLELIQSRRRYVWDYYYYALLPLEKQGAIKLPKLLDGSYNNAHLFYILCRDEDERSSLINHLKEHSIGAVFHYLSLHSSDYYAPKHDGRELPNCDLYSVTLLRLPLHLHLKDTDLQKVVDVIQRFYSS